MDAFSDILRMIRLKSAVYFRSDFSAPWGMEVASGTNAKFHMIVRGNCWLMAEGFSEPLALSGGDIIVFPLGHAHWLADKPDHQRVPGKLVVEAANKNEPMFQGDKVCTTLVCGHFEFNRDFEHPFQKALPPFIHLSGMDKHKFSWLESVTNMVIQETDSGLPGAQVVAERLAEVLFIQILRAYLLQKSVSDGYFAALKDPQISRALHVMHTKLEADLTLENIARTIGMSRAAFAARFKRLTGVTPMNYVTNWRMNKAREMLRNRVQIPLIDVAERVGYTSEAAFNRAFKRQFDENPGTMRRAFLAG